MAWILRFWQTLANTGSATKTCSTRTAIHIGVFELDDLVMLIGADASGWLLERGVVAGEGVGFVVHALEPGPRFLRGR